MRASLSQMVMQKDTKIYLGSGKRRPYVQRGWRICIILHLSACTGVNTSVVWSEAWYGGSTAYECHVAWLSLSCSLPGFPFYSSKGKTGVQV